jgi:hypothetical protein
MHPIDVALKAIDRALNQTPGDTKLLADRERLIASRGTDAHRLAEAIQAVEKKMQVTSLPAEEAAALLAEFNRLSAILPVAVCGRGDQ